MSNNETTWFTEVTHEGISLRDYFAAKALQGMYSAIERFYHYTASEKADAAYEIADAMLKAREQ